MTVDDEERQLRQTALQNVSTILEARRRAEQELVATKEALEEETRILELLNRTGAMLASNLDLEKVVQAVTDAGTQLSGAQFGAFFYAPTFRGEGVIRIADVREDPRYGQWAPHHGMPPGHLPVVSYLAVPVCRRSGEVIGGLFFTHPERGMFTERSERLIVAIAAQAAIAIDNAQLYEDARRAADERATLLEAERTMRTQVERVSLMKDEFLATLSHELRTPLNAILGWTELLLARGADDSTRRGLETIARNARSQAQLIEDLLDMSGIISGKIRLDVQRLELAMIVDAAVESVRPSADAKGIAIRKTIDPYSGHVFGDPNRLQQVVWNLLTNAVKFTPKGGTIDVLVHRINSHVEIVVHDTGVGISADFLPHVFERFRQADASTTRIHGGLGLGLSIVKQLVELHGGTVSVDSVAGAGATFIVHLPLRPIRDNPTPPGAHPTTPQPMRGDLAISLAGIRVLVVDDELDARELVKSVLEDSAAQVWIAGSAAEALMLVQEHLPDLIVSDIGMPDRDGYQLMRDVRALPAARGGRIRAIALTAFARSEDRTRAMLAGYQAHVAKPIEPQELVATIKSIAGQDGSG